MDTEKIKNIKLNFILTTARTGSTLLSTMLNMHPAIISTVEEPFAYYLFPKYKGIKNWTSKTIEEFCDDFYLFSEGKLELQFGTRKDLETTLENNKSNLTFQTAIKLTYLNFFPQKDKSKIYTVVDKQLKFHFCLGKLARFYPQSKFIILYRDPRDNACTKWQMFKNKKNYKELNYYRISQTWKNVYGKLNYFRNKIGNERFLEIKYEDLVTNPETELKKICFFLGLPFNDVMLHYDDYIKTELSNKNKSELSDIARKSIEMHKGLTEKVNTKKVGYWKQELTSEEANLIWTICGKLAEKIGYARNENYVPKNNYLLNFAFNFKSKLVRMLTYFYHASPYFIWFWIKKIKKSKTSNLPFFIN